jgi:hypothetical protein
MRGSVAAERGVGVPARRHARRGAGDPAVKNDDKPVPYARELWLPLMWMLIK